MFSEWGKKLRTLHSVACVNRIPMLGRPAPGRFMQLLTEAGVDDTSHWNEVVKKIQNDPRSRRGIDVEKAKCILLDVSAFGTPFNTQKRGVSDS